MSKQISSGSSSTRKTDMDEESTVAALPYSSSPTTSYHSFSETKLPSSTTQKQRRLDDENSHLHRSDPLAQQLTEEQQSNYHNDSPHQHHHHDHHSAARNDGENINSTVADSSNHHHVSTTSCQYRGFATSIADMFADVRHERVDCCAITCCGVLQSDRDRYLVTGVAPPSLLKRLLMHILFPLSLFFAAGLCAVRIQDVYLNQMMSTGFILLLIFYLFLQCVKGRNKRTEVRKDLLYTKFQIQQENLLSPSLTAGSTTSSRVAAAEQPYQRQPVVLPEHEKRNRRNNRRHNSSDERNCYLGQSRRDILCAHPCCWIGCYAEDRPLLNNNLYQPVVGGGRDENLCTCLYETACPGFCGMHCQLCGMCAVAQEARDIEICILPPPYRRIDYITMEAIFKYYPAIYRSRHGNSSRSSSNGGGRRSRLVYPVDGDNAAEPAAAGHDSQQQLQQLSGGTFFGQPLSRLSYRLLQSLLSFWIIMLAWSYAGPYYWTNIMGQRSSKHHFQVKEFSLLLLTFGQAFALLAILAYLVNRPKTSELSLDAIIKYFASGFFLSASLALFWEMMAVAVVNTFVSLLLAVGGVDSMDDPQSDLAWVMPSFAQGGSYLSSISSSPTLLARYYWKTDAGAAEDRPDFATVFGMDHPVFYIVYIFVATFVVAGFIEELCKYFGFRMVEHPDFFSKEELEEASAIVHPDNDDGDDDDSVEEASDPSHRSSHSRMDFSNQCQSVQARGAAITLAMVSVAMGFACCENLIYIFLYAGESFALEFGVLIERSFFPVHAILAAIQSIGVCQRELEASRATKLGRIILPAVMFHGTFDFVIVVIGFIGKLVGQNVEDGDLRISNTAELLSVLSCIVTMFAALLYLYVEAGKQRERLAAIDRQVTVDRSSLI